jgi:mono/diheme cytochrome c family protein
MPNSRLGFRAITLAATLVVAASSCFAEREPTVFVPVTGGVGGAGGRGSGGTAGTQSTEGGDGGRVEPLPIGGQGGEDVPPPTVAFRCKTAESKEPLPARGSVMSSDAVPRSRLVSVDTIFAKFSSACSACHIEGDQGGFHVTRRTFVEKMSEDVLELILSPDPDRYMPPSAIDTPPASQRPEGDASLELATLLRLWFDAGKPQDVFFIEEETSGQSPYLLSGDVGKHLSNIGNCIPNRLLHGARAEDLDEMFENLERAPPGPGTSAAARLGLPTKLSETDLDTLDSEELAKNGVIAYAPLYPLWSDDAGKLRHVRVPVGTSIRYDAATRQFEIPPNTRFYKTFLKKVIDLDGNPRFRKIETRLIVARPDRELGGGRREQTALYGAYAWNDAETEATLVTDLLRNGEPFADRLFAIELDEGAALAAREEVRTREAELAAEGFEADLDENLEVERRGLIRHYALPGSARCVQCHMGSPSADFVLGFTPLQVNRLPKGESGVIEESGPDELDQLERLIDYGVITGLDPDDLATLENSQGTRKPRNEQELVAQGYLLGNCSHCHNPRGFPSTASPELAPLLDFLPSESGGIFQFPLERTSPRIKRDLRGTTPVAYITPSLREITPKDANAPWTSKADNGRPLEAPWRSLIYRNVASPFTYSDDSAIFPHMPMNTPGFDCRAPQIIGDWMVSIPAKRTHPELEENYVAALGDDDPKMDYSPQPYEEVSPNDTRAYADAQVLAGKRLDAWHRSRYYTTCPDTSNIVDPAILRNEYLTPKDTTLPPDGVPDRPHWVVTDLTETPGAWGPRRSDWYLTCKAGDTTCKCGVLVDSACEKDACGCTACGSDCEYCSSASSGCAESCWAPDLPPIDPLDPDRVAKAKRQEVERQVIDTLGNLRFTPGLTAFATTPLPFGLWQDKPGCSFDDVPKVADFAGEDRPRWMDAADAKPARAVYEVLPGGAVFQMICINCHGPNADSKSRLADTVQTLTGGQTRIANLRDGFFGPHELPGTARADVFGAPARRLGLESDELAARYLVWMGLGGTQRPIPQAVLNLVGRTEVLGTPRPAGFAVTASANMLAVAQELCRYVVPMGEAGLSKLKVTTGRIESIKSPLIETNGDAELWERLCSLDNPPPLRALFADFSGSSTPVPRVLHYTSFLDFSAYPAGAPVGNHRGLVVPHDPAVENLYPFCIVKPSLEAELAVADAYVAANTLGGQPLPYCPASVLVSGGGTQWDAPRLEAWAVRGAVNAGLMVFFYLDAVSKGLSPKRYDQCELLSNP